MIQWLLDRLDISHITANLRRRGWTAVPPSANPCKDIPLPSGGGYVFPSTSAAPKGPREFDDLDMARGRVPYRSAEWYAIRDKLVASLNSPGPLIGHMGGFSRCPGCNHDDRGFVTIVGCPVHDTDEYRAFRAKAAEDLKLAQKMQSMLPLKHSPSDDGVSGE